MHRAFAPPAIPSVPSGFRNDILHVMILYCTHCVGPSFFLNRHNLLQHWRDLIFWYNIVVVSLSLFDRRLCLSLVSDPSYCVRIVSGQSYLEPLLVCRFRKLSHHVSQRGVGFAYLCNTAVYGRVVFQQAYTNYYCVHSDRAQHRGEASVWSGQNGGTNHLVTVRFSFHRRVQFKRRSGTSAYGTQANGEDSLLCTSVVPVTLRQTTFQEQDFLSGTTGRAISAKSCTAAARS